ncbi:ribonuclease HII [bacterium]|nr:ribonuclease HII [bacterium]
MVQLRLFEESSRFQYLIGVDEVGRGCLAGPVMAAAVCYDLDNFTDFQKDALAPLDDSKKLSGKRRQSLSTIIRSSSEFAIGHVSNLDIDRYNILNASMMAMEEAVLKLLLRLERRGIERSRIIVLVDGKNPLPELDRNQKLKQLPVTRGDSASATIASASIVAKVTRDRLMARYNRNFPAYFWTSNKGYPSKSHVEALLAVGPSPLHRTTFNWQRA